MPSAKFDVWLIPVEAPRRHTRAFRTPAGQEFRLTVETPDVTHAAHARELGNREVAKYVTGAGSADGTVATFPRVGGRALHVTEALLRDMAFIAAMQPEDLPAEERWSVEELVALSLQAGPIWSGEVFPWLLSVSGDGPAEHDLGNGSTARAASSSGPPAPEAASIHGSPCAPTAFSGRSTSASARCSEGIPESGAAPVALPRVGISPS